MAQHSSQKLEKLVNRSGWSPSIDYKSSLNEIRSQATPSEIYRAKARTFGRKQREMDRLKFLMELNYEKFTKAALIIQKCYRGMKKRQNFQAIKGTLEISRAHRLLKEKVLGLISSGAINEAIEVLENTPLISVPFLVMKAKLIYSIGNYKKCEVVALNLLESTPTCEDAHYLYVSSLASQKRYSEAYDAVRNGIAYFEYPREDLLRIHGLICMKMEPPLFSEALEAFDSLVQRRAEDMNALLQRAMCYICLHDWERAVEDLSVILHYQPKLANVICLRARVNMCRRSWDNAKSDYKRALRVDPSCSVALLGLQEVDQPYEEMPMVDPNTLLSEAFS